MIPALAKRFSNPLVRLVQTAGPRFLPFSDAATAELPMGRLLRLSLFQVTVGMALVLVIGTLNRVMIVELEVPSWIVGIMISLPLLFAPFRALVGFRSDTHRCVLGWRRVPYLAMGTMLQFGGLAIMPMALMLLSGDTTGPMWIGQAGAALSFLLLGAGMHTVQTAGLALATELAPAHVRPRVVALLCAMLIAGMIVSAVLFGWLLSPFSPVRLIQVIQGAAMVTAILNFIAIWQQEPRDSTRISTPPLHASFTEGWAQFAHIPLARRRLIALGIGTAGFSMQDVLLEPYGGQILHLPVAVTTAMTALLAVGGMGGLWLAARRLAGGADTYRVAASGAVIGVFAFSAVILSAPFGSMLMFALGTALIGFGGGLFAHGALTAAMSMARGDDTGTVLGIWGAVQATAAGLAIFLGGAIRDAVMALAGPGADAVLGYSVVYHLEIGMLFITLVALGPLVQRRMPAAAAAPDAHAFNLTGHQA
jgi:MFS transporter, BCD family, chlorophyll transporter